MVRAAAATLAGPAALLLLLQRACGAGGGSPGARRAPQCGAPLGRRAPLAAHGDACGSRRFGGGGAAPRRGAAGHARWHDWTLGALRRRAAGAPPPRIVELGGLLEEDAAACIVELGVL
eukprot:gene46250-7425_t